MAFAAALKLPGYSCHCTNPVSGGVKGRVSHPAALRYQHPGRASKAILNRRGTFCSQGFRRGDSQRPAASSWGAPSHSIRNAGRKSWHSSVEAPLFNQSKSHRCRVEECRCSEKGETSTEADADEKTPASKSFDDVLRDVVEDDISLELSLEDIVKDVVASRIEANTVNPETGQSGSKSSERSAKGVKDAQMVASGSADEGSHKGLKIEVAPKVLEALDSTGELGNRSLFDIVEEKRKRKAAEKAKAAAEEESLFTPLKDVLAKLKFGKQQGGAEDIQKTKKSVRKDVRYTLDMDSIEPPPLQQTLDLLEESLEDGDLQEYDGWMQGVTKVLTKGFQLSDDLDSKPSVAEQFTRAINGLIETSQYLIGINGRPIPSIPTPIAEKVLDVWVLPGQRKVTGSDLERLGVSSRVKTVDWAQLQREVFRSGPFYAQWSERWRNGWVVTGYLEGDPAEARARLQARLDQHFPEHELVVFLLNTPEEVPWCLILPAHEPIQFAFPPTLRQSIFASAVVSAFVMWLCKGMAIADPLLQNGEDAAIALVALPLGLLSTLFAGSIARAGVASLYGVRNQFPIPLPLPGLGAIGMTTELYGVVPSRAALIDIPLAGSLATAAASVAMMTSSHSWLDGRFPQSGPLILVPPGTLDHSYALSYLVSQLQKAAVIGPDDVVYMALHPLAFAGLLGLNATALSLLPLARTDGGRITQGLIGRAGHVLTSAATCGLLLVGFIFGDTSLSLGLYLYNSDTRSEWYQKDEVSEVGVLRTLVACLTMALGVAVLSPTLGWIPFHSLAQTANSVPALWPSWGNI